MVAGHQSEHHTPKRGLARPRFADQAHRLPGRDFEVDPVDRGDADALPGRTLAIADAEAAQLDGGHGNGAHMASATSAGVPTPCCGEMTCDHPAPQLDLGRSRAAADGLRMAATGGKCAIRRAAVQHRRHPGNGFEAPARALVAGRGADQRLGVGMARRREHFAARARLHDAAAVHHEDARAAPGHRPQIVAHDHQAGAGVAAERHQQVEDGALDRGVQRRRRFVGDHDRRVARDGQRDHDPLRHAAGQFVGKAGRHGRRVVEPGFAQQFVDPGRPGRQVQRQRDLAADPHRRVQRRHRILEHEARAGRAGRRAGPRSAQRSIERPSTRIVAAVVRRVGRQQAADRHAERRLARAAFADDADRLVGRDRQADAVQRHDQPVAG